MSAVYTDPLVLEIMARTDKLERSVKSAQAKFTTDTDRMKRSSDELRRRIEANNGAIGDAFKRLAGPLAAGVSVREIAKMADSYTRFSNQLKVAGLEGENLASVQGKLFQVAQRNGVELEAVGTLYSRAAQNQKELGASTNDLISLTRAVSASLKISGTSTEEASGSLLQLGQALGSPRIQAEEFNSLLDTMQPLLRGASKYIDGTGGSLAGLRQHAGASC